jgi:cysteine desulfurase
MRVYLDNAASTRVDDRVFDAMVPYFREKYAIATSQFSHSFGAEVSDAISLSRQTIASHIGANQAEEIIFTSSGTEANNLAIKGAAYANSNKGKHLITSQVEHLSVLESIRKLEREGFEVSYLPVDSSGLINIDELKSSIRDDTILVSIQLANHETGTLQNLGEIANIVKNKGVLLHTDAAISYPYINVSMSELHVDLMTISPHKFYGPKGIGILFVRNGTKISKIIDGGFNEFNLRAGSENVPGIVGAAKAVEIFDRKDIEKIFKLKNLLSNRIDKEIIDIELNGNKKYALPHILNYTFNYIEGEAVSLRLDFEGIAVTTGSACYSRNLQASYILLAMGKKHEQAHGSIRFSLSKYNTEEEVNYTVDKLKEVVSDLRNLSPLGKE